MKTCRLKLNWMISHLFLTWNGQIHVISFTQCSQTIETLTLIIALNELDYGCVAMVSNKLGPEKVVHQSVRPTTNKLKRVFWHEVQTHQTMNIPALTVRMKETNRHQPLILDPLTINILSRIVSVQWYHTSKKWRTASIALLDQRYNQHRRWLPGNSPITE